MFQKILLLTKWKKAGLKGVVQFFTVNFSPIDTNNILDIRKYLMKKTWCKLMFGLIKKIFIVLLIALLNGSNHRKCVLLSNKNREVST